jgi:deaminated glutathione amidase
MMRVSVVQMSPTHEKARNIREARRLIEAAVVSDRPDVIGLPEVWSCLGGPRSAKFEHAEVLPDRGSAQEGGPAYEFLREMARTHRLHVHGGSIIEREGERLFNTTLLFDPAGLEVARYRKVHLFDIVTPDGTGYRESATFGSGKEIVTVSIGSTLIGCAICYDVRFPELFLALRRRGAELIMLPAAFTLQTGKDHWETLLRTRAIETQCWLAAAATWGRHTDANNEPRFTYGHSLICDPWGHVVAKVSDGTGWATARIDHALTEKVRADMPVLEHRKLA